ncbi:MAG: imidazoleglycerol-phosphate dehydratase HisB [Actinobacteria bacterium]|nr:imidazoleglycerol-phosphate dehydratase HisB [Actinomycetota bacterium]
MNRTAKVMRKTKETQVELEINLDGTGKSEISTGVGFFDHMLEQISKHGAIDLKVKTTGDTHVDSHHSIEDTAIALGQALRESLGDKAGIRRFGSALIPLDEALAQVVVDLSGRPYCVHEEPNLVELIGDYDTTMTKHVFESIAAEAKICLHIKMLSGRNSHHIIEAQCKGFGRALRDAVSLDERMIGIPSTKGSL